MDARAADMALAVWMSTKFSMCGTLEDMHDCTPVAPRRASSPWYFLFSSQLFQKIIPRTEMPAAAAAYYTLAQAKILFAPFHRRDSKDSKKT